MPAIKLAKRLRRDCEQVEHGIIDGQWTGLHYFFKALEAAAYLESQGGSWTPDVIHAFCRGQTLQHDTYFVDSLFFELLEWNSESEIQGLLSKLYWHFLNSDSEDVFRAICEFYNSVEPS
ncbi:hypothetical protein [Stutzerimonas nitrititolerans]|uniref:hypothetical protein n=1 Tax=Stutzerimonas nitrititolerans TaxID=2482751 RepID=UPI00289AF10D|nr:hypothetical protein [Stutzerimonas nitrititolerans]